MMRSALWVMDSPCVFNADAKIRGPIGPIRDAGVAGEGLAAVEKINSMLHNCRTTVNSATHVYTSQ
jgi:hypothetical protein